MLLFCFLFTPAFFIVNALPSFFYVFSSLQDNNCNSFFFNLFSFFFEINFTNLFFLIALFFFFLFFYKSTLSIWWALVFKCSLNIFLSFHGIGVPGGASLWNGVLFIHPAITLLSVFFFLNFFFLFYFKASLFKDFFFFKYYSCRFFFFMLQRHWYWALDERSRS